MHSTSLLGMKTDKADISDASRRANFTNEGGVGYIRLLKNIAGLWVVGQLRKEYGIDFAQAQQLAKSSDYTMCFDINDSMFTAPTRMSEAVIEWFEKREMDVPETRNDILNAAYHSIAASYRQGVCEVEAITKRTFHKLYIIGGGAHDNYLNALTTRYTKKEVIALPIEATAIGNIKIQLGVEAES